MRTLTQAIERTSNKGGVAQSLLKHLNIVGIREWKDFTRTALYELRDHLLESVSPGTAKTILSNTKALINRNIDCLTLPNDWQKILSTKGDTARGTFLNAEELAAFEAVHTRKASERIVQVESLIEAYTGARVSDVMTFSEENFSDSGYLTYTSQKTKVTATIPVSEKTKSWIRYAQQHREDEPILKVRNDIIRRIARIAGIDTPVKTRHGGEERITPKWEVLSSHCMRRSCATNLIMAGASLTEAKMCLGHTNTAMTERYLCQYAPKLSREAMAYFNRA